MKSFLKDLPTVTLRPSPPPVVRHSFYVVDTTPDHKPAWIIPERLALGSQDCAFSESTRLDFTHVINVGYGIANAFENDGRIKYLKLDVSDLAEFQMFQVFEKTNEFIDEAIRSKSARILVHCQAGVSRSATVLAAYLMLIRARSGLNPSIDEVLDDIRKVRPSANPNVGFVSQLRDYERQLRATYPVCLRSENEYRNLVAIRKANSQQEIETRSGQFPFQVRLNRFIGQVVFAYHVLRPSVVIAFLVSVILGLRSNRGIPKLRLAILTLLGLDLSNDDVFRANVFKRLSKGAKPGLFYHPSMQWLVDKVPALKQEYKIPMWYRFLGGDASTISFVASGVAGPDLPFRREEVSEYDENSQSERRFSLDWAFPAADFSSLSQQSISPLGQDCCLMLAGIGGNSESAYVRDVAASMIEKGLVVAILLARGLGICSHVEELDRLFDPTDDGDVHHAVIKLAKTFRRVVVVGFSLGGVTSCRYFSRYSDIIPPNVKACVSISGAFKVGFMTNPRYENVYQKMLVPGLIDDIVGKYGQELEQRLGSLHPVLSCTSYRDIHKELYTHASLPGVEQDFTKWRELMEACPSRVTRPLLLVTALDDPLHHPEQLGLNRVWTPGDVTDGIPSENVIILCTDGGGHVAWPESLVPVAGYTFLRRITGSFIEAVLAH